ncbi:hypothetical protein HY224_02755, partial [Candidatus Uhrbacteria bacterium]|nr:hypothetical protein [Candidatus Uhrbacteria bacterium]
MTLEQQMDSHLGLMAENVKKINDGDFNFDLVGLDPEVNEEIEQMITESVRGNVDAMDNYVFLHDMEKPEMMALKYEEKLRKPEIFTMAQWKKIWEDCGGDEGKIHAHFKEKGVKNISYMHTPDISLDSRQKD